MKKEKKKPPNSEIPFVICLRADIPTPFTDNVAGLCVFCSVGVQHRPHVPTPCNLVCMDCAKEVQAHGHGFDVAITSATLLEVAAWINKGNQN